MTRALFINSGILGQRSFADGVRRAFAPDRAGVEVTQVVISDDLTIPERIMRKLLCARILPATPGFHNLDLHRLRCEVNSGLLARNRIRRLERAGARFDVLHFHRQGTAYASLGRMRRIPSIVSIDSTQRSRMAIAHTSLEAHSYGANVKRDGLVFDAAKLIIATSEWARRSVRREYPDCETDIEVMPPPIDVPAQALDWARGRHARALRDPAPRFLFVGGDFPRKGGHDLLDAWRAGGFADGATLDIMSDWPLDDRRLPAGVTVHRNVTYQAARWHALWRDADIFVLPTRDEAFGLVFQEAAAAALPAIGTNLNAVPEVVQDGLTGVLVKLGDGEGLIAAMKRLAASPDLRREMGERATARVAAAAGAERYWDRLAAAIRRLAGH